MPSKMIIYPFSLQKARADSNDKYGEFMRLDEVTRGAQATELIYLRDSYLKVFTARIIRAQREKGKAYLVLDKTAFHPKSGGQPTDTGIIDGPGFRVGVRKVMIIEGVTIHWGRILEGEIKKGDATGRIDWNQRHLYMRRHTAGHLLDHCIGKIIGSPVETTDAWHGEQCYVGYRGSPPLINTIDRAVGMANQLIINGAPIHIEFISAKELLDRSPNAPNIYRLPRLDNYRIVTIEGCEPIPCGGTHLNDIKDIKNIVLNSIKEAERGFKVYYDVLE